MTSNDFATVASSWIGALTLVVVALLAAAAKVAPYMQKVRDLYSLHEANKRLISDNKEQLTSQQGQIVNLALHVPPPNSSVR